MKTLKYFLAVFALMMAGHVCAQTNLDDLSDKELSMKFDQKIKELNAEINLVKTKMKGDKLNSDLKTQMVQLKNEVKVVKQNKKIVDTAIKKRDKADKAIAAAETAQKKAEEAKQKALKAKKEAEEAARKAILLRKE